MWERESLLESERVAALRERHEWEAKKLALQASFENKESELQKQLNIFKAHYSALMDRTDEDKRKWERDKMELAEYKVQAANVEKLMHNKNMEMASLKLGEI